MSIHQPITSHEAALESLPADPTQVDQFFGNLYAQKKLRAERMAKIREEIKIKEYKEAAEREMGFRRNCLRAVDYWEREFERNPFEASVGYTQLMFVGSRKGWNKPVEKPEDETPVMDRTKTAQRMVGYDAARGGSRSTFGMTVKNTRQMEITATAERLYQKLKAGVPYDKLREGEGAGRPSNAWQDAQAIAWERFQAEQALTGPAPDDEAA